jgi:pimeloyl-ACP methyl ester carboxylesterase
METALLHTPTGNRLAIDVWQADGPKTVFLLHGGGQTRRSWFDTAKALAAEGYRVVCYDARGHGESDWVKEPDYTLPSLASDFVFVRKQFLGPAVAIGASMGGMTAFYAAGVHEQTALQALVLVDIALKPAQAGVQKITTFMRAHPGGFANVEEARQAIEVYRGGRQASSQGSNLANNVRPRPDGRLYWHWDPQIMSATPESFHAAMLTASSNVRTPVLLVRGSESDVVTRESITELLGLVPQTDVVTVDGLGHMVAGDNNLVFYEFIRPFLATHLPMKTDN